MEKEEEKYNELLKILRKSGANPESMKDIGDRVIERIEQIKKKDDESMNLFDYLFGWVYIGWVRRSLIAAAAFIVVFFVYQQSIILKRINALSNQPVINESSIGIRLPGNLEGRRLFYKLGGRKIKPEQSKETEKQIEEFLESVDDLQDKYKDLIKLIEEDPVLKKEIEKRMTEKHKKKFNI